MTASEASVTVTNPGRGDVIIRCDVGDPNGDHMFHLSVEGWPRGQTWEIRLDAPPASVRRDDEHPGDTFDGEVEVRVGAPSGMAWQDGEAIRVVIPPHVQEAVDRLADTASETRAEVSEAIRKIDDATRRVSDGEVSP